jgi:hypothetical protein
MDGVIAIAESLYRILECEISGRYHSISTFWVFNTKVEEQDEDELADEKYRARQVNFYQRRFIRFVGRSLIK